jgi:hypothetical protein
MIVMPHQFAAHALAYKFGLSVGRRQCKQLITHVSESSKWALT